MGGREEDLAVALSASELFASSQTLDWKLLGVGAGTSFFSYFRSRVSSQVYGSFKTSDTNGMKSNMSSNEKITTTHTRKPGWH